MTTASVSTSVSLLYVEQPDLDFARYVENLERALREAEYERFDMRRDHEDFVTFDLDGSRVSLGYSELDRPANMPGHAAILVLAVGPGLRSTASRRIALHGRALLNSIRERIAGRHPADLTLWTELEGIFTADHFDSLVDNALALPPPAFPPPSEPMPELELAVPAAAPAADGIRPHPAARHTGPRTARPRIPTALLEHRLQRLPPREQIANDLPDIPHASQEQAAQIREALYPPEQHAVREKEPLARRLTIYTFNTTLLMVSLPVGAALLTYNVLGREDSRVTARVMALTGFGFAFAKAVASHQFGFGGFGT